MSSSKRGAKSQAQSQPSDQGEKRKPGRPKGSKNTSPPPDLRVVAGTTVGTNSTLSDSEQAALLLQWKATWARAKAVADKAKLDLANIGKKARADCGEFAVDQIKLALKMDNAESAKKERERMDREAMTLRWIGLPIGGQGSLFEPDRRTAGDIAEEEGFAAGSDQTTPKKPPEKYGVTGENAQRWMKGFDKAQDALFAVMEKRGTPVLRGVDTKPQEPEGEEPEGEQDENPESEDHDMREDVAPDAEQE